MKNIFKFVPVFLLSLAAIGGLCSCTLVPTDFMPKAVWSWSQDAKDYRAQQAARAEWNRTNQPAINTKMK